QNRQRDLTDAQRSTVTASAASATAIAIPAVATWTNKLTDQDTTVGLGVKQTGLLGGKLDLSGDLTYATGAGVYSTALNYATATTGGLTCASAAILSCGQLPDIKSTMSQFKLTAGYQFDKSTKVMLRYVYQHLTSSDYYYNGYQYGYSPSGLMPTNQLAPNYSVNALAVSLIHNF
ncbi:MAG: MtrB/PioB family outer membrane beta-barrel protein, partial [Betaproteobacteria bacterium]